MRLDRADMHVPYVRVAWLVICGTWFDDTATHCNTLQHTATHCNALQHTATHCNTLHHTATHCNALQHTATHCNTLQQTSGMTCRMCHLIRHIYVTHRYVLPHLRQIMSHTCCSVLQCVAVCCSVLQCDHIPLVAVCCSVIVCVTNFIW